MKEIMIGFVFGVVIGILVVLYCCYQRRKRSGKKRQIKINGDTMTSIVIYSLLFCGAVTIAGMILGAFDHDVSAIVGSTHRVFGTELGICGVMTLYQRWEKKQDIKDERRRRKKEEAAADQAAKDVIEKEEFLEDWLKEGMAG